MIEEETMQKIIAIGLLLLMLATWMVWNNQNKMSDLIEETGSGCSEVVDIIYQQCSEEGNINLTTLEGRTKTLTYENGVCVIK